MTIDRRFFVLPISLIIILIIYIVSRIMTVTANEGTVLYIDMKIDKHLIDDVIVNVELIRDNSEYSEYIEKKLININARNENMPKKIPLENSPIYKIFINYNNSKFFNISKDQIYYSFDTDVKNKFEIKEIDNQIYLIDYGLYKVNDTTSSSFDTYLLKKGDLSDFDDPDSFINTQSDTNFKIQPMDMDSINYFSRLPQSELDDFKFIPSDHKKIDELRSKNNLK